jgi:hypothetical protein
MEAIAIESNVGLCGLKITALPKESEMEKLAAKVAPYLIWHDGASASHSGGKKAKFTRESPYSEEYGEHVQAAINKVLAPYFDVQSIETYAHVKQSEEQKFMKFCKSLGMSEEQAKAGWTTAQAAKAEQPAVAEKVLE